MSKYKIGDIVLFKIDEDTILRDCVVQSDDGTHCGIWHKSVNYFADVEYKELRSQYTHISPSALKTWSEKPDEWYMKYMSFNKPPSIPQTQPMAIGSAFDAYAKSYIIKHLSGGNVPVGYSFEELFEKQVEPHNRDWALIHGKYAFDCYKTSGALADLMLEINGADTAPRFEFEVKGTIKTDLGEVKLQGRPDLKFHTKQGAEVVIDWKLNGYQGNSPMSPKPHYNLSRDGWTDGDHSRTHRQSHKDACIFLEKGIHVNTTAHMENVDKDWATQLCVYAWLMGAPVGSDFVNGIEQLACSPGNGKPKIRISSYRMKTKKEYQEDLFQRLCSMYEIINSDHIFRDVSKEESQARCKHLDSVALSLWPTGDAREDWLKASCR
jgi:hypothetical protein